ncbi:uncharacterized protein FIBRA_02486 [Fibroporia radiculosa]|uniref:Uncharacterized protein n=1 Tax=Fibroporia radiculosa TaxID=599839 RepID=J4G1Q3_9APHY|nr:uncharacterized protein FIBRA_02486 [Fibroporia radiculosa]CCM00453.1 predicted protein [Fibroporia radiculosa]
MQQPSDRRWSELIPPHTALTFAAVWDPVDGLITFSGAQLLDSEVCDRIAVYPQNGKSPRDALDTQSQALTIDMFTQALSGRAAHYVVPCADKSEERIVPSSWACEAQTDTDTIMGSQFLPVWLIPPPGMNTGLHSPACASSAAVTALFHDPELRNVNHWAPPKYRLADFGRSHMDDESISDEGFFEGRQLPSGSFASLPVFVDVNMSSAFSVTTTSTNNYVEVDFPSVLEAKEDSEFLTDGASSWETLVGVDRTLCLNVRPVADRGRRLRKVRVDSKPTTGPPASPAEVLSRAQYNHVRPSKTPSSSITRKPSIARAKALLDRLGKCVKHDDDGWVCIEVTQKVTQKVTHNIV